MNLNEAYTILELTPGTSPEEAKKKYRELTKKYHPDVNKEKGAEDKFKKINEAYQCVQNGKGNDREPPQQYGNSPWGSHARQQVIQLENIEVHTSISFKESVLGCKKELKYVRQGKCQDCSGTGEIKLHNGCKKCGGKGQVIVKQGHVVMVSTCTDCFGRSNTENCKACSGQGLLHTDVSVHVSIPGGIANGSVLRLQGMGNYAGSFMGLADQHTDAFCHVAVTPEAGLDIDGTSVVSHVTIPLIDALRGCTHKVKTIHGDKEIRIKPQSRNRDEVIIPHCGVSGTGDQRVILDVQYPKNTDKLIGVLLDEVI
jgi:molecular chaperone DnaJ